MRRKLSWLIFVILSELLLFNVSQEQKQFIEVFGEKVLSALG
jgi:hypothetical protein